MKAIPLTRRHHLQHFTTTLEAHEFSSERLLGRLNMPMWQYGKPDDLVPLQHVLSFFREASRVVGEERLGLLVGEKNYLNNCTTFGALVSRSPTVYHAMQTACKLASAHSSLAKVWLVERGDTVWFCRGQFEGMAVGLRQHEQYLMAGMIGIVRLGAGSKWKPSEIWLCTPHQPRLEETGVLSGVNICYGQPHGAIAVPRSLLCLPLRRHVTADPQIESFAEKSFRSTAPTDSFVGSVRQVIGALLSQGQPSIETMAEIVGTNVRTFQRRLQDEKVTFKHLIDEARFNAATGLLEEPGATVTDIAFDLGYGDTANFSRAFRRWAGVSPREYRRLRLASSSAVDSQDAVSGVEDVGDRVFACAP